MKSLVLMIYITLLGTWMQLPQTLPKDNRKPTQVPPTADNIFVPDLRLRGSESVEVDTTVPKSYRKITFTFENWDKFPAGSLEPTSKPPSLPPNPCKQVRTSTRLFAVLHAKNGEKISCAELKPREDFSYLFEKTKYLPAFVFVTVVDRTRNTIYKSSMVSPTSGATP